MSKTPIVCPACGQYYCVACEAEIHARTCTSCLVPIVDDEGNPQFRSEACKVGARLIDDLQAAYDAERERTRGRILESDGLDLNDPTWE